MGQLDSKAIVNICLGQGFALAGITAAVCSEHGSSFESWLSQSKHGEMEWLQRNVEVRLDPHRLLDGAQSIICVADRYGELDEPELPLNHGRIARYARGKDYHKVMKRRLHVVCDELQKEMPMETCKACVDTAPIFEREFAARAGLGATGKHTLLIEQGVGSWMLLGVIVTTAKIESTEREQSDPCATCTRCIDACPTDAITPFSVDARRCISYLTIEHRSEIDREYFTKIGQWIFGCDICQEVCPHTQQTIRGTNVLLNESYAPKRHSLDVLEVLEWDEESRRQAFQGSSMKRATLSMMRRNAVIVLGNILAYTPNDVLLTKLQTIASLETDQLVKKTAVLVLENLLKQT